MSKVDRSIFISLLVAIAAAVGSIIYLTVVPSERDTFTEFYILGAEGKADDYPGRILLGEPAEVVVGVVNHEHRPSSYRVEIAIDGTENCELDVGTLTHQEKWEQRIAFVPDTLGKGQEVDFYLYKDGQAEPYFDDPVHLYVDVATFRVLNAEGKAGDYPTRVEVGDSVDLIVVILNCQPKAAQYRAEIEMSGICVSQVTTELLAPGDKCQELVSFSPWRGGREQKVEVWLYENGEAQPYHEEPQYFHMDVIPASWSPE